ncbi:MAG: dockerin type I repeat-containing protein, partial [Chthoniobacterales bacterium]
PAPGVVSRKIHGAAGTFDISLPVNGAAGVECRTPGSNGSYQLVFTFDRPVATSGTASVTQGTGSVATGSPSSSNPRMGEPNQVVVDLTGVTNQQRVVVMLSNVQDTSGNTFDPISVPMDVLLGDVNADRAVNSADATVARNASGQLANSANFRSDVNLDGVINSADATLVRNASGSGF